MTQANSPRIGPVYREQNGLFLDDFYPGLVIEHHPARTISETDNTWITLLTLNRHPLHIDSEYASKTEFGRVLVNSSFTFALVNGLTVEALSSNAIANLGWDEVRLPHPVFVGDTLHAVSTCLEVRDSRSRPGQGIVTVFTEGLNASNQRVISFRRSFLLPKRPAK